MSELLIEPVDAPVQFDSPQIEMLDLQVDELIRTVEARTTFSVSGKGLVAAVLDSGLRVTHADFQGRVRAQRNFTADNGADPDNANDANGHGTNVGGIIAANGIHTGIAIDAGIVPVKVLHNSGHGSFKALAEALQWVIENRAALGISCVCMSLGDGTNRTTDDDLAADPVRLHILELRRQRVPVCVAAGNFYFRHNSGQGMCHPAILREAVSIGAVYDANEGGFSYKNGAQAHSSKADQITPFSQRLHDSLNPLTRTDIFAPGAPVTSAGIQNDNGESVQQGTSQAAPVTAGVILLMQELHLRLTGELPEVDDLVTWMRQGAKAILDGDDEDDNVRHTGLEFRRLDAVGALDAVRRGVRKSVLLAATAARAAAV